MTKTTFRAATLIGAFVAAAPFALSAEPLPVADTPAMAVSIGATFSGAAPVYGVMGVDPNMGAGLGLQSLAVSVATGSHSAVANSTALSLGGIGMEGPLGGTIGGATSNGGAVSGYNANSLESTVSLGGESMFESEVLVGGHYVY